MAAPVMVGQGAAEARLFAQEGASVILGDVRDDQESLGKELSDNGYPVVTRRHDVTSEEEWAAAVSAAEEEFGGLHVLVNNAGILSMAGVEDTTWICGTASCR